MRKCRSCASLLLGEADACPRCGAPLAVVTAGAAAPAVAATPASPASWPPAATAPTAPPAAAPPSSGPPPPTGAPVPASGAGQLPPLREAWQPVAIAAPPAAGQPRSTRVGVIALVIAIVVVLGLGVMHLRSSDSLPAGTSAFVSGGGSTYTSPDGAFQLRLPQNPVVDQRVMNVNSQSLPVYFASADTDDYAVVAASITLPEAPPPDRVNAALDDLLNGGLAETNGTLVKKTLTMRGNLPAVEGKFTLPHNVQAHLLVVLSGNSLIMLIVGAHSGTDRLYKALEDSLIVR